MKIRFAFRPAPLLAAFAFLAAAIAIGNFQLRRAEQKQAAFDQIEAAGHRPPVQIGAAPVDAALLEFQPAAVRGRWMGEKTVLIDNRTHHGIAGYHVITPLRIDGTQIGILVNRGWVAAPRLRSELPQLPVLTETPVEVKGVARRPPEKTFVLAPDRAQGIVWQHLALERFRTWAGIQLQPVILLQTDAADEGFLRDWFPAESGALKHWGFALVWYLAAAVAAIAAIVYSVERRKHEA